MDLHRKSVAKYIKNEECQIITDRSTRGNYSLYLDYIIEGYCKGKYLSEIYNTIKNKDFNGSKRGLTACFDSVFKQRNKRLYS